MTAAVKNPPNAPRHASPEQRRPNRKSGGGGGFWWFLAVVVLSAAAVCYFNPDFARGLIGLAKSPDQKQEIAPTAIEPVATPAPSKNHELKPDETKVDTNAQAPKTIAPPDQPTGPKLPHGYPDDLKAEAYLKTAETEYTAMHWDNASNAAHKLDELEVSPRLAVRAKDIIHGSIALEKLFNDLGQDKDELVRGYDTNPNLAVVDLNGKKSYVVPVVSLDTPTVIEGNPVTIINNQRNSGVISMLIKGLKDDYTLGSVPADQVTNVQAAPLKQIQAEKAKELTSHVNRLENGHEGNEALSWYNAGRFAYRNRLDGSVTQLLDRALLLDPGLVKSVRENKAGTIYANMIFYMQLGSPRQAALFMGLINRRYADTDNGKLAKLYFEHKTSELLAATLAAKQREVEAEELAKKERLERAKKLGDQELVAKINKAAAKEEEPADTPPEATPTTDSSSPTSQADKLFAEGMVPYQQAQQLGNTDERNALYHKAEMAFRKAKALLSALAERNPNDQNIQSKLIQASELAFGAHKYQTDF